MPDEPIASPFLAQTKAMVLARIVSHMDGVGRGIVGSYPMAEVQSWPIQRGEAIILTEMGEETVLLMTEADILETAPFLLDVCTAHYGQPADDTERATRLWAKAVAVKANADTWEALSAFVNGLRARCSDRIGAALDNDEVFTIESETQSELTQFRDQYGV